MTQNVGLLGEINNLIKEQHSLTRGILIMEAVNPNGMNMTMDDARVSEAEKELKLQETVMENLISQI